MLQFGEIYDTLFTQSLCKFSANNSNKEEKAKTNIKGGKEGDKEKELQEC